MVQDDKLEIRLAWVLRTSVTLAFFVTLIGYVLFLSTGKSSLPTVDTLTEFGPDRWKSAGWGLWLTAAGVMGFIAVPVSRVVYSAFYFAFKRNFIYTFLSCYVLLMVGLGILVGAAG